MRINSTPATVADIKLLEGKVDWLIARLDDQSQQLWITTAETASLLGCTDRHIRQLVAEGTISLDAVRNVGTPRRPKYRYHRHKVLDQVLKRS
jgi:excisionase family DNA binding protein